MATQHFTFNTASTSNSVNVGGFTVRIFTTFNPPAPDQQRVENLLGWAKAEYHRRAKELHPDAGGSTEDMQRLNAWYDAVRKRIRSGDIR